MARPVQHFLGRADLDDLAQVHHRHAVADLFHHRDVVRDEQVRQAHLGLQLLHQLDHACLHRHVQRRHRLVGHDDLGIHAQRAGDADALALAARELVGVAVQEFARQADPFQQLGGALAALLAAVAAMHLERLADQVPGVQARVERRVRILEDHLDVAPHRAHLLGRHVGDVLAGQADRAGARLHQLHQQAPGGRLAHQRQRLAGAQIERHALDRVHVGHHLAEGAGLDRKALGQARHFQHGRALLHRGLVGGAIAQPRHRGQQVARVGLGGRLEQRRRGAFLDLVAVPHHHHAVGDLGHHAHVVRDEQHGHADLALQVADQVDDLGLHRDVERGGRFVGDQELRPAGQRHRDHHALAHAAGQVARILRHAALGLGHLHRRQHLLGAPPGLLARDVLVQQIDFGQLVADRHHRVERGHRLLEDHRDLVAADAPQGRFLQPEQVYLAAVARHEAGAAAGDAAAGAFDQAQDRQRGHRFAGAGLAHQRHRFAAADGEVQRLHRPVGLGAGAEFHAQALHRQ